MTTWNLYVVGSFVVLYAVMSVVFFNVLNLQKEILSFFKKRHDARKENAEKDRICAEIVLRKLTDLEISLGTRLENYPDEFSGIKELSKEVTSLANPSNMSGNGEYKDGYQLAHRLFSLGVSKEKILERTKLGADEVEFISKKFMT